MTDKGRQLVVDILPGWRGRTTAGSRSLLPGLAWGQCTTVCRSTWTGLPACWRWTGPAPVTPTALCSRSTVHYSYCTKSISCRLAASSTAPPPSLAPSLHRQEWAVGGRTFMIFVAVGRGFRDFLPGAATLPHPSLVRPGPPAK